jgi:hypothetical protein
MRLARSDGGARNGAFASGGTYILLRSRADEADDAPSGAL